MRDLSYFRASLRHEQVWRKVYSIFFPSFNSALLEFEEKRLEEVITQVIGSLSNRASFE
jgi:hypothetical protein